jgi:large subunit ribosomal protein L25
MMLTLEVKPRDEKEGTDALRTRGTIPAVFYGRTEKSTPIAIDRGALESTWRAAGETTIITLKGAGEDKDTLIKDIQMHPVTGNILHVDFYVLEKGKKVHISVPLEFVGEAPAEKAGHIISKALHELEIEVTPAELPHTLEVDLSKLADVGDHITAGDVKLPPSAELKIEPEEVVVSVMAFVEEKEEAPAPEATPEGEAAAPTEGGEAAPAPTEGEEKSE